MSDFPPVSFTQTSDLSHPFNKKHLPHLLSVKPFLTISNDWYKEQEYKTNLLIARIRLIGNY